MLSVGGSACVTKQLKVLFSVGCGSSLPTSLLKTRGSVTDVSNVSAGITKSNSVNEEQNKSRQFQILVLKKINQTSCWLFSDAFLNFLSFSHKVFNVADYFCDSGNFFLFFSFWGEGKIGDNIWKYPTLQSIWVPASGFVLTHALHAFSGSFTIYQTL